MDIIHTAMVSLDLEFGEDLSPGDYTNIEAALKSDFDAGLLDTVDDAIDTAISMAEEITGWNSAMFPPEMVRWPK